MFLQLTLDDAPRYVYAESVPDGWLTVTEAAKRKGVPDYAIRNAINRGALSAEKVGDIWLIRIEDVDKWNWVPRSPGRPRLKKRGRPRSDNSDTK